MMKQTPDQKSIQEQIDACAETGGGTVSIKAGRYTCGTLYLKSGVALYLESGAEIRGTDDLDCYPFLADTVNESADIRALIHADNAENISITGDGVLHGGADRALECNSDAEPIRPELLFIRNCKNVTFRGIHMLYSSFWTLHLMRCEDVLIDGITIRNRYDRINTDGIDPDGCKRVRITNCNITAGDDCIVLKSTEGDDCEDIVVSNCLLTTHCAALKLGTESFGNIRNVVFSNCVIRNSRMAFGIFMKDGGTFENIIAHNLVIESQGEFPLFIDSTPRFHGESKDGLIRNVTLSNITIQSNGRLFVNGSEHHPVENLRVQGVQWDINGYFEFGQMGKPAGSVRSKPNPDRRFPERKAAQFTLSNIRNVLIRDVQVSESRSGKPMDRALLYTENVENLSTDTILDAGVNWISATKL